MARPTTKIDLIEVANIEFNKLWEIINSMSEDVQITSFSFDPDLAGKEAHWKRDKNIRDVLIHLYEWHQLLLNWVNSNQNGEAMPFIPAPYNWRTYGQMNIGFWEKHQNTTYDNSIKILKQSHLDLINMLEGFSSDELFSKNYFTWTGSSTLGSYCTSATSSHYIWAIKKLKKHIKTCK